jgi:hypothetical protein
VVLKVKLVRKYRLFTFFRLKNTVAQAKGAKSELSYRAKVKLLIEKTLAAGCKKAR